MTKLFRIALIWIILSITCFTPTQPIEAKYKQSSADSEVNWQCWDEGEVDPCHRTLHSISMISETDGWAVGNGGVILHWNGIEWYRVNSPTNWKLRSVEMINSTEGWAVGNQGVILRWDGIQWTQVNTPTRDNFNDLIMITSSNGWAVGDSGAILHWDGNEWSVMEGPAGCELVNFYSIDAIDSSSIWIGSNGGNVYQWDGIGWNEYSVEYTIWDLLTISSTNIWAGGPNIILHWNGIEWVIVYEIINDGISSISMITENDIWFSGGFLYHWNGSSIKKEFVPTEIGFLNSIDMVSTSDGWAVGSGGAIVHYSEGISGWEKVTTIEGNYFEISSIAMVDNSEGWVVGNYGQIFSYDGENWKSVASPTEESLKSVTMLNSDFGWAVGLEGIIIQWDGSEWKVIENQQGENIELMSVTALSETDAWAVGASGKILHWDGDSWINVESPTEETLISIAMISTNDGWSVGRKGTIIHWDGDRWESIQSPTTKELFSVSMISSTDGWIGGEELLHWDGESWNRVDTTTDVQISKIVMTSPTNGLAVSGYTLLRWDGKKWSEIISEESVDDFILLSDTVGWGVDFNEIKKLSSDKLWVSEISPNNKNFRAIQMLSSNHGYALGGGRCDLYQFDGRRWDELYIPEKPYGCDSFILGSLSMIDYDNGWAVGGYGLIIHWDGTKMTEYPSPASKALSKVKMLSNQDGWIVGDGGTILRWDSSKWNQYPSPTSGKLWDIDIIDENNIWAVGEDIIHWDGNQWNLEWAGGGGFLRLTSIDMISSSDGWAVGGSSFPPYEALILHWDGIQWIEVPSPVTYAALNSVGMISSDKGWIAGGLDPEILGYFFNFAFLKWNGSEWNIAFDELPVVGEYREISIVSEDEVWVRGKETLIYYRNFPLLFINYSTGAPGSYFTVDGTGFPVESALPVFINGVEVGFVQSDTEGEFSINLETSLADEGDYIITVGNEVRALSSFNIDINAPVRPMEGSGDIFSVPAGISYTELVFMPITLK